MLVREVIDFKGLFDLVTLQTNTLLNVKRLEVADSLQLDQATFNRTFIENLKFNIKGKVFATQWAEFELCRVGHRTK